MMIVTGGTGFIGSNTIRCLNERGISDILIVDDVDPVFRGENLSGCKFSDYIHKTRFSDGISQGNCRWLGVDAILHQGACTDTMESDKDKLFQTNFTYSKLLLDWAIRRKTPFIYASSAAVYGPGPHFGEDQNNEMPLNLYARSKWMFDCHVRDVIESVDSTVVGLRYFNVYGRNEAHKGRMASIVHQLHQQLLANGVARLFGASPGYKPGEQQRDFVLVDDVVKVILFFLNGGGKQGIYNVATGTSRTFNEVANILISLTGFGRIEYIPFPPGLSGQYQNFTRADITRLRNAGYKCEFSSLENGIKTVFS